MRIYFALLVLLIPVGVNAQRLKDRIPVFKDETKIGYLYAPLPNTNTDCSDCYAIDTIILGGKALQVKLPVTVVQRPGSSRPEFDALFSITNTEKDGLYDIAFNNTQSAASDHLFIKKKNGRLQVIRQFSYSSAMATIAIGKNDNAGYPATYICNKTVPTFITGNRLAYNTYFKYNAAKDCFYCPVQHSCDQCLEMKKERIKFTWKD